MYAFIVKRPNKGEIIPKKDDILPEISLLSPSLLLPANENSRAR